MHELVAICGTCNQPIDDGDGHLYAPFCEIRPNLAPQPTGMREALALESVLALGKPIRWRARHFACTEHEIGDLYQICVEEIRTWAKLTEWTAHLLAKRWVTQSNWGSLLMSCATGGSGPIAPASALTGA